jgi:hypothetical protein
VIFDGSPDPSAVYPGNRGIPKSDGVSAEPTSNESTALAWDKWYADINKAIWKRFIQGAAMFDGGPSLRVVIDYSVTKDKQITNVRFDQVSPSLMFNVTAKVW